MSTRKIKDAKDLSTNELIYFKGHAKATYMSDGRSVEDAINTNNNTKQDLITDIDTIRAGANKGSTAVQPYALASVATSGSYNDLTDKPETSGVDIFVWDYSIEGSEGTVTEDKLQRIKECDILRIVISGIEIDATRGYQPDLVVTASLVMTGIISVMIQFSGLNYVATTDIRNVPTEEDISGMGFTKNTGTISKIKINGSTFTRQIDGVLDIGNYQVPLVSGTNIATFGGKPLLGSTDLLATQIITSNIAGNVDVSVGNCYIFSNPQSTVKTFNLIWPGSIYNNSLTIIINLNNDVSISFASNNWYPILWANGTTPTLESGKQIYEINFRPSPAGWLGVVVPFTVN